MWFCTYVLIVKNIHQFLYISIVLQIFGFLHVTLPYFVMELSNCTVDSVAFSFWPGMLLFHIGSSRLFTGFLHIIIFRIESGGKSTGSEESLEADEENKKTGGKFRSLQRKWELLSGRDQENKTRFKIVFSFLFIYFYHSYIFFLFCKT